MIKVVRTAAIFHPFQQSQSFFHSSPVLERRRRTNWESKSSNNYDNRTRKPNGKWEEREDVSAFAENLFQRWWNDHEEYHPSSSRTHYSTRARPWFRQPFFSDKNRGQSSRGHKPGGGRRFHFCEDDDVEVEHMFRTAFGGNKNFFYSFTSEDFEREYSSSYNTRSQRKWRHQFDDEYNSSEESATDLTSYRLTLGLKASGPLNLEDVKNAYRTCALKWHPDRHQGSSKAVAEEKFKICSAAYQSLYDQLTAN